MRPPQSLQPETTRPEVLRIALYQCVGKPGDIAGNLALLRDAALEAQQGGAQLLVFPELFLSGYEIGAQLHTLAEPQDGPSAAAVRAVAQETGVAICYGYPERGTPPAGVGGDQEYAGANQPVYNAALLVNAQGETLANYRKTHLFGAYEQRHFTPGAQWARAELHGWQVALLICYDVEFPEAVRAQAMAGAQLVLVPTAVFAPYTVVPRLVVPCRAWENQLFVAYANRCGQESTLTYLGESTIAAPDGTVLARASESEAGLIYATLDPALITAGRTENPYLDDLRPELYPK